MLMVMRAPVAVRFRRRGGLGTFVSDCTGPNPNCGSLDSVCIANWTNINSACEQAWITNPAMTNPNLPATTTQIDPNSAQFKSLLAAAGGSAQMVQQGEGIIGPPPGTSAAAWWSTPGATVAGVTPTTPAAVPPAQSAQMTQGASAQSGGAISFPTRPSTYTSTPAMAYGTDQPYRIPTSSTTTTTDYTPWIIGGGLALVFITLLAKR